jgi:MOSC domain-containing protein YiiM
MNLPFDPDRIAPAQYDRLVEILEFVVSPTHRFDGRPSDGPTPANIDESRTEIELRAGRGIVGDRYFGTRHRHAAVTLISADEVQSALAAASISDVDFAKARRNIVLRGVDVEALVNTTFTLDSGAGPVRFRSLTRANPCAWMDEVFGTGARDALRGHAGIRAEPLDDGSLRVGPVMLSNVVTIDPDERAALKSAGTT